MCIEQKMLDILDAYNNTSKGTIVVNLKSIAKEAKIKYINQWISEQLGIGIQPVYQYMALNEYRQEVKFPLKHLCKLAVALNVSVYEFFAYVSPEQISKAYKRRQPEVMAKYKDIIELKEGMTFKQLGKYYGISEGRACSIYKNRCLNLQNTKPEA